MSGPNGRSEGVSGAVLAALAIAICCGGPLLFAAVATTGAGAALAALGWAWLGLCVTIAGLLAAAWWWLRQRRERVTGVSGEEASHG